MFKKLVLIVVVLTALLATASSALAVSYGNPGTYYVDTAYTGTETGTSTQPYNTFDEAKHAAENNRYGGNIYTKTNGRWVFTAYIASVVPPDTGTPISGPALFILLGFASLILVAAGWLLMRRSRAQLHQA